MIAIPMPVSGSRVVIPDPHLGCTCTAPSLVPRAHPCCCLGRIVAAARLVLRGASPLLPNPLVGRICIAAEAAVGCIVAAAWGASSLLPTRALGRIVAAAEPSCRTHLYPGRGGCRVHCRCCRTPLSDASVLRPRPLSRAFAADPRPDASQASDRRPSSPSEAARATARTAAGSVADRRGRSHPH